jgi:hypothetical protein
MRFRGQSGKPPVIEYLYERYKRGEIADGIVTSDLIVDAIEETGAKLGKANPANFLKDIVRTENANAMWPESLKRDRVTARQRYGAKRVMQFVKYRSGQTDPFPDQFLVDQHTKVHEVQSASLPFAARQLGRQEEAWLTQVVVNLRVVESQLSIFSPERDRVRDVTHLQMSVKTQPEIDAVFLASYGATKGLSSATDLHLLVTCEAKQFGQRILEDQIREQVAKAMEITNQITNPRIEAVKPIAIKVIGHTFARKREKAIYVVEFARIGRKEFAAKWLDSADNENLYSMPLEAVSKVIYRVTPPIAGLNA